MQRFIYTKINYNIFISLIQKLILRVYILIIRNTQKKFDYVKRVLINKFKISDFTPIS